MRARIISVLAAAMLLVAGETQAQKYSATDIGSLGGSGGTLGNGLNDFGEVVGESYTPSGNQHAFAYSNGIMIDLGTLGGLSSNATAINNTGIIVGGSYIANGNEVPFSYSNGTMTNLNVGALQGYTAAAGINNAGVIVGSGYVNPNTTAQPFDAFIYKGGAITIISNPGGTVGAQGINSAGTVAGGYALNPGNFFWDPFTYSNGTFTSLGAFGPAWVTYGLAINDSGTIVGYTSSPNTNQGIPHAFSYSNGVYSALGTLAGGSNADAEAINNAGVIVGQSTITNSGGNYDAFIYSDGTMVDLNSELSQVLPTTLSNATAINNVGQIVAIGANGDTYLLSPTATPEPGSLALLVGAGASAAYCLRRRRYRLR